MSSSENELQKSKPSRENGFGTISDVYRLELQEYKSSLKARYNYENDEEMKTEFDIAESLLDKADGSLNRQDKHSYLRYFYSALRRQIPILAKLDSLDSNEFEEVERRKRDITTDGGNPVSVDAPTRLQAYADRLYAQSEEIKQKDVREKIQKILHTPEGKRKENLNEYQLDNASRFIHDEYIMNYESISIVERIIRKLNTFLMFLLVVLLAIVTISELFFNMSAPIDGLPVEGISEGNAATVGGILLYIYVVFVGIFGAVISNLLKFYDLSARTGPRMPDEEFQIIDEIIYARILVGGTAAAFLYTVLLTGVIATDQFRISAVLVIIIAFVAGFSDRLFIRALNTIEEKVMIK